MMVRLRPIALRLAGIALLVPLASALTSTAVPIYLRLALAALWLLAVVHPHAALIALAALVPFGSVLLAAFDAAPIHFTEALVLAMVSGGLIAAARPERTTLRPQSPPISIAAVLFSAVIVSSAAVIVSI